MSAEPKEPIKIWPFHEAPLGLREFCNANGGDEDWLVLVPPHLGEDELYWLNEDRLGCCCVDVYEFDANGSCYYDQREYDEKTGRFIESRELRGTIRELANHLIKVGSHS
jgi:hypothetical protein